MARNPAASPGLAGGLAPARLSRGAFLRWMARAAGAGVVVLATGTTWRALDQGVFASGQGPASQAWRDWPGTPSEGLLALVRSAVLAADAHDTQPWLFVLGTDRIDLFVDASRNIGTVDPLRREQHISLGCALENLTLAARATGFR